MPLWANNGRKKDEQGGKTERIKSEDRRVKGKRPFALLGDRRVCRAYRTYDVSGAFSTDRSIGIRD
jgi:hypothetical protein